MRVLLLVWACLAGCGATGDGFNVGEAIRGIPGMVKSNFAQFKTGCGQMWQNSKEAGRIRKSVREDGATLSYAQLQLLRNSGTDTTKLLQAGFVWLFCPELFPALLYFNPKAIPSTFESEKGATKRRDSLARMRTKAALELLTQLEEQAASGPGIFGGNKKALVAAAGCEAAERMLRERTVNRALVHVQSSACAPDAEAGAEAHKRLAQIAAQEDKRAAKKGAVRVGAVTGAGKIALMGLPQPALKAGCKVIGVSGPMLGPMRRGALGKHLEGLVEGDAILASQGTKSLTRQELLEACIDRGFGSDALSDQQLRSLLDEWLGLLSSRRAGSVAVGSGHDYEPHRLRLAAMSACAIGSVRREREALSTLPRLLYSN